MLVVPVAMCVGIDAVARAEVQAISCGLFHTITARIDFPAPPFAQLRDALFADEEPTPVLDGTPQTVLRYGAPITVLRPQAIRKGYAPGLL